MTNPTNPSGENLYKSTAEKLVNLMGEKKEEPWLKKVLDANEEAFKLMPNWMGGTVEQTISDLRSELSSTKQRLEEVEKERAMICQDCGDGNTLLNEIQVKPSAPITRLCNNCLEGRKKAEKELAEARKALEPLTQMERIEKLYLDTGGILLSVTQAEIDAANKTLRAKEKS